MKLLLFLLLIDLVFLFIGRASVFYRNNSKTYWSSRKNVWQIEKIMVTCMSINTLIFIGVLLYYIIVYTFNL
jgi:hypothetical protein